MFFDTQKKLNIVLQHWYYQIVQIKTNKQKTFAQFSIFSLIFYINLQNFHGRFLTWSIYFHDEQFGGGKDGGGGEFLKPTKRTLLKMF